MFIINKLSKKVNKLSDCFQLSSKFHFILTIYLLINQSNGQLTQTPLTNQRLYGQPLELSRQLFVQRIQPNVQQRVQSHRLYENAFNNAQHSRGPNNGVYMNNLWPFMTAYKPYQQMTQKQLEYRSYEPNLQNLRQEGFQWHSLDSRNHRNPNEERLRILLRNSENQENLRRNSMIATHPEMVIRQPLIHEHKIKNIQNQNSKLLDHQLLNDPNSVPVMDFHPIQHFNDMRKPLTRPIDDRTSRQTPNYPELLAYSTSIANVRNDFETTTAVKRSNENSIENQNHDISYISESNRENWKQKTLNDKQINKSENILGYYNQLSKSERNRSKYILAGISAAIAIIILLVVMIVFVFCKQKRSFKEGKRSSSWTTNTMSSQMPNNDISSRWLPTVRVSSRTASHVN